MEQAQLLYELQNLELRIAADGQQSEAERAKMVEPAAIRQARAAIQAAEQRLAQAQRELRSTEQEAESVTAKKTAVHAKLYGGQVSVPRELTALEAEEAGLARTFSQLEDRELELMSAAEKAERDLEAGQRTLEEALTRWRDEGQAAHEHIDKLETEVEELKAERAALTAHINAGNLATYERLKPRKVNRPVSVVENSMCQACRVTLPSGDVHRARGADPPHTCDNCGRILYVR